MQDSIVRVLVIDDYELFRTFLCATLQARTMFEVVGVASDGVEAVQLALTLRPDLILLDLGLPKLNGIEAAHRILALVPTAKILFVSQMNDPDVVAAALDSGGKGYVYKQKANTDLLPAIEAVLDGEGFLSLTLCADDESSLPS